MTNKKKFRLYQDEPGLGRAGDVVEIDVTPVLMGATGSDGRPVMMAATPADTSNQQETLETYLGGYSNRSYCADELARPVIVAKEAGKRRDHSKENAFQHIATRTGRSGIKEIQHGSELVAYQTEEYGLAAFIPWASENDADANYNIRQETSKLLMNKLMLDREIRLQTLLQTTGTWNSNNHTTLLAASKWNGGSSADPLTDLRNRINASAQPVGLMVCSPLTAGAMLETAKIRDLMRQVYGDAGVSAIADAAVSSQEITRIKIAGFPDLLVCAAKVLNETTGNLDFIWGSDFNLLALASGNSPDEIASVMTLRHRGRSGTGVVVNEYMPYGRGINGGTMLEVGMSECLVIPSNISGGLIKAAYQA